MNATAPCDPPGAAPSAWAATLARLRRRLPATAAFMVILCLSIAVLLNTFDRQDLGSKLVYSFSIGLCCWLAHDATRLALAWTSDRLRAARGLAQGAAGHGSGWRAIAPAIVVCVLAGPTLGSAIADRITGHHSAALFDFGAGTSQVTLVLTLLGSAVSVYVLSTMERLSSARAQAEAAQRLAAETQLRLLQSQLEPHMLFNTLANLRVLIGLEPARAQAMLDRLIAFLRATLNASRMAEHPLATEFERLADYLALMGVRMGPRLQVALDLPEALRAVPVPPLLLQPLVENGIQHGLEPNVEGGRIVVQARQDGRMLQLTVRDTGVGLQSGAAAAGGGFGLAQVRERLATLYGEGATVVLEAAPDALGGTLATLRLPLSKPPAPR
jgi:signal transduction histidine kinase